jgi:chromosome segregation ATPase
MRSYKVIVGLIALSFAAGIFGGYRIWGTIEKGKTDIRQLLRQLNEEVDRIESNNRELSESLEASREKINASEAIRKENQDLKDRLQKSQQENTEKESLLTQVRSELSAAKEEAVRLKKLRELAGDLNARISVLENENQELKSVIDNISEITQRKEVPDR